jgi:hypothetical protein
MAMGLFVKQAHYVYGPSLQTCLTLLSCVCLCHNTTAGVPDCDGLAALDWLVNRLEAPDMQGIQLMPTLTNCVPTRDYGGLWQYVL